MDVITGVQASLARNARWVIRTTRESRMSGNVHVRFGEGCDTKLCTELL